MKKYLWIPCGVLGCLLALSLWNASAIEKDAARWRGGLEDACAAAEAEDWPEAERALRAVQDDWAARGPYLHLVTAHATLNEADMAFAEALSYARGGEGAECQAAMRELIVLLDLIADRQQLSVRNLL